MGEEQSTPVEIIGIYGLLAALAGEGYSRQDAIGHIRLLMEMSRSPYISTDVKRAIGFVQSFTFSLSNLSSIQMAEVVEIIHENKQANPF